MKQTPPFLTYQATLANHVRSRLQKTTTRWQGVKDNVIEKLPTEDKSQGNLASSIDVVDSIFSECLKRPENQRFSNSRASRLKSTVQTLQAEVIYLRNLEAYRNILNLEGIKNSIINQLEKQATGWTQIKQDLMNKIKTAANLPEIMKWVNAAIDRRDRNWQPGLLFSGSQLRKTLIQIQQKLQLLTSIQPLKQIERKLNDANYISDDKYVDELIRTIMPPTIGRHTALEDYITKAIKREDILKKISEKYLDEAHREKVTNLFLSRLDLLNKLFSITLKVEGRTEINVDIEVAHIQLSHIELELSHIRRETVLIETVKDSYITINNDDRRDIHFFLPGKNNKNGCRNIDLQDRIFNIAKEFYGRHQNRGDVEWVMNKLCLMAKIEDDTKKELIGALISASSKTNTLSC